MSIPNKNIWIIVFFSLFFTFLINWVDFYCMITDNSRWVPVNTPPFGIGDEYHYFSVLKMMAFGNYYGIPYDSLNGILYLEFIRIVPYIINLPIYYIGSEIFDCRYGILFVRLFDMLLLFFAMYYFFQIITRLNKWKDNCYFSIFSIFLIFYGFNIFQPLLSENNLISVARNIFVYITRDSFIYTHATINDLNRAIIASATAPIILFIFALRLSVKNLSLMQFLLALIILAFTSLSTAIAFGLISLSLDVINKVSRYRIIWHMIIGLLLGVIIIAIQTKLIFGMSISAQEVINFGSSFSFGFECLTAPFISILIILLFKRYLSPSVIVTLLILSLFQPISYIVGGGHGSRLWLRSTIIPFIVLFVYLMLTVMYSSIIKYYAKKIILRRGILIFTIITLAILIGIFTWRNNTYLITHNEKLVYNSAILSYILDDRESSIVITNSTQISMLTQLYDKTSTPLMSHFSLQGDGYKKNWEKTLASFELLGVPSKLIIENIRKVAPIGDWQTKREVLKLNTKNFENFYFDDILFMSTYATYNYQMLKDKVKNEYQELEGSFYQMQLDISSIYSLLDNKKLVFIVDQTMPFSSNIYISNSMKQIAEFENIKIFSMVF